MNDFPEKYDPNFPYPPVFDGSETFPDPAWDYTEIWGRIRSIKLQVENLEVFLQLDAAKYANPAVNQTIREHIQQIDAQSHAITILLRKLDELS